MAARTRNFKIGVFVIAGVALVVGGLLALGANELIRTGVKLETYLDESAQGLEVGSAVKRRGVKIGSVDSIRLATQVYGGDMTPDELFRFGNYVVVEFTIEPEAIGGRSEAVRQAYISRATKEGYRARIESSGLTGVAYLEIDVVDPDRYPPLEYPWDANRIVVPSAPGTFANLIKSASTIFANLEQIDFDAIATNTDELLVNLDKSVTELQIATLREKAVALLDEARGTATRVNAILDSEETQTLLADAAATVSGVRAVIDRSGDDAAAFLESLPGLTQRVNALADHIQGVLDSGEVERALADVRAAAEHLPPTMRTARLAVSRIETTLATHQRDIEDIIQNFRAMSDSLRSLSGEVQREPARLLFGGPPPRVGFGAGPGATPVPAQGENP